MTKILIVSDTHGDDTWIELINQNNYDYVIHAGDHLMKKNEIRNITNFYVDGNNDWYNQHINKFKIENLNFILVHGDEQHVYGNNEFVINSKFNELINNNSDCNILIFGHTHIPYINKSNNVLILNPGSMSVSRHNFEKCYIELIIDKNSIIDIELKKY